MLLLQPPKTAAILSPMRGKPHPYSLGPVNANSQAKTAQQAHANSMKHKAQLKTPEQVRAEFDRLGISVAEWSRAHAVNRQLVYEILAGKRSAFRRGQSHRIAVLLGLKHGEIPANPAAVNAQPLKRAA